MTRHELIMSTKTLPKHIDKNRINQIFNEYEKDIIKERNSDFQIVYPQ